MKNSPRHLEVELPYLPNSQCSGLPPPHLPHFPHHLAPFLTSLVFLASALSLALGPGVPKELVALEVYMLEEQEVSFLVRLELVFWV